MVSQKTENLIMNQRATNKDVTLQTTRVHTLHFVFICSKMKQAEYVFLTNR